MRKKSTLKSKITENIYRGKILITLNLTSTTNVDKIMKKLKNKEAINLEELSEFVEIKNLPTFRLKNLEETPSIGFSFLKYIEMEIENYGVEKHILCKKKK